MPVTKDGQRVTVIFNAHGIPSRRTIGMFYEMQSAEACAKNGTHMDEDGCHPLDQAFLPGHLLPAKTL